MPIKPREPRGKHAKSTVLVNVHRVEFDLAVARCIRTLLGNPNRGTPSKAWVNMTPTRYGHAVELMNKKTFHHDVVTHAINIICTSSWLKKPIQQISDQDVSDLLRDKPWERDEGHKEYAERQEHPLKKGVVACTRRK